MNLNVTSVNLNPNRQSFKASSGPLFRPHSTTPVRDIARRAVQEILPVGQRPPSSNCPLDIATKIPGGEFWAILAEVFSGIPFSVGR